jgi:spoIIIJ-associated protein
MEDNTINTIKDTIQDILEKMGFQAKVEVDARDQENTENITCNIFVESDSHFLIGQHGINLQALQHIARLLVRKKIDEKIKFSLDVNNYRQERNETVIELARLAAQDAVREGRAVVLRPMSAYERRLVHLELAGNAEVATESIGEGEGRKVVVKPSKNL